MILKYIMPLPLASLTSDDNYCLSDCFPLEMIDCFPVVAFKYFSFVFSLLNFNCDVIHCRVLWISPFGVFSASQI